MNTLVTSESEVIKKITNELISSVGYIKVSNFWNITLISILTAIALLLLFSYFIETEECKKQVEVKLIHFGIGSCFAIAALSFGLRYTHIVQHNDSLGLSPAIIKASITSKTDTLAINISTGADLLDYTIKGSVMSVISPTEDKPEAITLSVPGSTTFIEDTQEYLTVPATTFRVNSSKIKGLITPELVEEIESSVSYGVVTEVHYIPIKKKKKMIKSGEAAPIKPSDVTVTVNTEVTVK